MITRITLIVFSLAMTTLTQEYLELPAGSELIVGDLRTSFRCPNHYGYFADVDTNCRVFHICQSTHGVDDLRFVTATAPPRRWSFFCGNQTVFNQLTLTCSHEDESIPCEASPDFFYLNDNFGHVDTNSLTDEDVIRGRSLVDDRLAVSSEQSRSNSIIPNDVDISTTTSVPAKVRTSTAGPKLNPSSSSSSTTPRSTTSKSDSQTTSAAEATKAPRVVKKVTFVRTRPKEMIKIKGKTIKARTTTTTTTTTAATSTIKTTTTAAATVTTTAPTVQTTSKAGTKQLAISASEGSSVPSVKKNNTVVETAAAAKNSKNQSSVEKMPIEPIQERADMSEIRPIFERLQRRMSTFYRN